MYLVQSVLLRRDNFSPNEAMKWIHEHNYKATKIDITPQYYRFRQVSPDRLHGFRIRSISLGDEGYLLVAYREPQS